MIKKTKILILSVVKVNDNYKITYCLKNDFFTEEYKGLLIISYLSNTFPIFYKFNKYGKWVNAILNSDSSISKIF